MERAQGPAPGPELFLVEPAVAHAMPPILARPAARLCGAARVLARHLDELGTPARTQLLAEMDKAADALALALLKEEGPREVRTDPLDEVLRLRCSCL